MSTSHSSKPPKAAKTTKRPLFEPRIGKPEGKAMRWLLDRDGDLYGDEQERLAWYEGTTAAASVQWIVLPWTLAAMAWLCSRSAAIWVVVLLIAYSFPMMIASKFVINRGVRIPTMKNRKMLISTILTILPLFVTFAGLVIRFGGNEPGATGTQRFVRGIFQGALFGGGLGLVGGIVGRRVYTKKLQERARATEDLD